MNIEEEEWNGEAEMGDLAYESNAHGIEYGSCNP